MAKVLIGLFRGINVGGNHLLPMKELKTRLVAAGFADVQTYIASGNVVFRSAKKEAAIAEAIESLVEEGFGFRPPVFVLSLAKLKRILTENPFKDAVHQGKAQHVFFLRQAPTAVDRVLLDSLRQGEEAYAVTDEAVYLYAPEGIGRSKLAEKIGRAVKAEQTARNLNTVEKLREMAEALEA